MIERRPFSSLGVADHGWLRARHHFSFAGYHDPSRMGWGARCGSGTTTRSRRSPAFRLIPTRTWRSSPTSREGAITHEDSLGNVGRTEAGDVQVMSAGRGVRHAEYNVEGETTRLFQLWIVPSRRGGEPAWAAKPFPRGDRAGRFVALASGLDGDGDALPIRDRRARARCNAEGRRGGDLRHEPVAPSLSGRRPRRGGG